METLDGKQSVRSLRRSCHISQMLNGEDLLYNPQLWSVLRRKSFDRGIWVRVRHVSEGVDGVEMGGEHTPRTGLCPDTAL